MQKRFQGWTLALLLGSLLACGGETGTMRDVSPDLLASELTNAVVLDVRGPDEFAAGHVPTAINLPHDQLEQRLAELALDPDAPVVVYCESGRRAGMAAEVLARAGHRDIRHLEGDMSAWRASGRPVERL